MLLHENHTCTLQVGGAHANHLGYQSKGPHCMWIAHCAQLPYALHFKTFEIENRLKTMRIDTTHQEVKKGHIVSTCQLHVMAKKCKRHCETFLRSNEDDKEVKRGFAKAKCWLSAKSFAFANRQHAWAPTCALPTQRTSFLVGMRWHLTTPILPTACASS